MNPRVTTLLFWGGLVVAVVVVAVSITDDINREPLDFRSVGPDGARAVVELAEVAGADVEIGIELPTDRAEVAVLLTDTYGVTDRRELTEWVERGGRLVVTDRTSPLTPAPAPAADTGEGIGACPEPALSGIGRIAGFEGAYIDTGSSATRCFGGRVIVEALGDGVVVSIGGPGPLLNENLARADNAVLAVALLAPRPGTTVAFVEPRLAVVDGENLEDLVGDPVWLLLVQIGVGFSVIALWKARRIGRPVPESVPVQIAGSELAAARGRLLAGLRNPTAAATELRSDARRTLARAVGLAPDADLTLVANRVAHRSGLAVADVDALLVERPVAGDAELLAVATALAELTAAVDSDASPDARAAASARAVPIDAADSTPSTERRSDP